MTNASVAPCLSGHLHPLPGFTSSCSWL